MRTFKTLTGPMAYLPMANIDTDMIIPKQYLKTVKRTGLGKWLFAELRYNEAHQPKTDFILNQPAFQQSKVLLTGENFGCGSSREHAVWSLVDFGIEVVIAPSFADIFYSNCFKNGLLPIALPEETIQEILIQKKHLATVNLESQTIHVGGLATSFPIEPYRREALLQGLDEIGETLRHAEEISSFEAKHSLTQPWLFGGWTHE